MQSSVEVANAKARVNVEVQVSVEALANVRV